MTQQNFCNIWDLTENEVYNLYAYWPFSEVFDSLMMVL